MHCILSSLLTCLLVGGHHGHPRLSHRSASDIRGMGTSSIGSSSSNTAPDADADSDGEDDQQDKPSNGDAHGNAHDVDWEEKGN